MDRDKMTKAIIDDMEEWAKRDEQSFWDHVHDLELAYLKNQSDKELEGIYEASI